MIIVLLFYIMISLEQWDHNMVSTAGLLWLSCSESDSDSGSVADVAQRVNEQVVRSQDKLQAVTLYYGIIGTMGS